MKMKLQALMFVTLLDYFVSGMESRLEYELVTTQEKVNAFEAWKHCLNKNKTLASIQNAKEEKTIIETFQKKKNVSIAWIGLFRIKEIGMIVWMDGSSSKYIKKKSDLLYHDDTFGDCAVLEVPSGRILKAVCSKKIDACLCQSFIDSADLSLNKKKTSANKKSRIIPNDLLLTWKNQFFLAVNKSITYSLDSPRLDIPNPTHSNQFTHVYFVTPESNENKTLVHSGSAEGKDIKHPLPTEPAFDIGLPFSSVSSQKTLHHTTKANDSKPVTENSSKIMSATQSATFYFNNQLSTLKLDERQTMSKTFVLEEDDSTLRIPRGDEELFNKGVTSSTFLNPPFNAFRNNSSTTSAEKTPLYDFKLNPTSELRIQETLVSAELSTRSIQTENVTNFYANDIDSFSERNPSEGDSHATSEVPMFSSEKSTSLSKDSYAQVLLAKMTFERYSETEEAIQALRQLENHYIQLALNYKEFDLHDEFQELHITTRLIGDSKSFSNLTSITHFTSSSLDKISSSDPKKGDELTAVVAHVHLPSSTIQMFNDNSTTVNANDETRDFVLNDTGLMTISAIHRAKRKVMNSAVSFTIVPPNVPSIESVSSRSNASLFESQSLTKSIGFVCKFIDLKKKAFSSQGCESKFSNDPKSAHCKCSHTTAFSVLLSVTTYQIPSQVKIVSFVTQSISIIFLIVTLVVLTKVKEKIRSDRTPVQINLTFALLLLHSISICHDIALLHNRSCEIVAVLTHFTLLASVCWMLVEGITLVTKTLKSAMVKQKQRTVLAMRYGIGWLLPACIVLISALIGFATQSYMKENPAYTYTLSHKQSIKGDIRQYNQCWIGSKPLLVASVVIPVVLMLAVNTIILIRMSFTIFRMNTTADNFRPSKKNCSSTFRHSRHLKATVKSVTLLLPVLGFPLIVGLLAGVKESSLVWMYMTSIANGLQGFFLFVIYCIRGSEVRNAAVRTWSHSRTYSHADGRPKETKSVSVIEE